MKPPGLDQISRQLKLTDDQKAKVKPIIEARDKKLAEMTSDTTLSREERRARFQSIRDETTAQMKPILTPEQFEKWQMTQRMHRPGGPPPPAAHSSGTNAPVVPPK